MIDFEYFIKKGDVKKCPVDRELAKSLAKDMFDRIEKSLMLDTKVFPKIIFENIYDALRDFCDALLTLEGFKSYSHQASIAYLSKQGFDIATIEELDQFRFKRNSSKYYGQIITSEDAQQIKDFYLRIKNKIKLKLKLKERGLK